MILTIVLALLAIISCGKEQFGNQEQLRTMKSSESQQAADSIEYGIDIELPENNQDIWELILNENDPDDEKINTYLYYLAIAIEDLVKSRQFNEDVIYLARTNEYSVANLTYLFDSIPYYKSIVNNKLKDFKTDYDAIANDFTHSYPGSNVTEYYAPCIYIPNIDILNSQKQPIFSPNIDSYCDEDESLEDCIVVWFYNTTGNKQEAILSEELAFSTTNPIFILDNGNIRSDGGGTEMDLLSEEFDDEMPNYSRAEFFVHIFTLKERFESSGKSEYAISAYVIDADGHYGWLYDASGSKKIAKVSKSDINNAVEQQSTWSFFFWDMYYPHRIRCRYAVLWNTFEYDWARSSKDIGIHNINGQTLYNSGKCKYNTDTYAYDRANCQPFTSDDANYIYDNWAKWYGTIRDKGLQQIWRVHPDTFTALNLPYYYF